MENLKTSNSSGSTLETSPDICRELESVLCSNIPVAYAVWVGHKGHRVVIPYGIKLAWTSRITSLILSPTLLRIPTSQRAADPDPQAKGHFQGCRTHP